MSKNAVGFMSYVRSLDDHDHGQITNFCKLLSGEVCAQSGHQFSIFQDRTDIDWGEQWAKRINDSIDTATFLIPIITPSFFTSQPCRDELERFLVREGQLGRDDLIMPVYYITCQVLIDKTKRKTDPLADIISNRQYTDWRELRFKPFTDPNVRKLLAKMAVQIHYATERVISVPPPPRVADAKQPLRPNVIIDKLNDTTILKTNTRLEKIKTAILMITKQKRHRLIKSIFAGTAFAAILTFILWGILNIYFFKKPTYSYKHNLTMNNLLAVTHDVVVPSKDSIAITSNHLPSVDTRHITEASNMPHDINKIQAATKYSSAYYPSRNIRGSLNDIGEAQFLMRQKGDLDLRYVTSASKQVLKILSQHQGKVILTGLVDIDDERARILNTFKYHPVVNGNIDVQMNSLHLKHFRWNTSVNDSNWNTSIDNNSPYQLADSQLTRRQ